MENQEYLLLSELTAKQNRKNILKVIFGGIALSVISAASMWFFMYVILIADKISDKIIGIL